MRGDHGPLYYGVTVIVWMIVALILFFMALWFFMVIGLGQ